MTMSHTAFLHAALFDLDGVIVDTEPGYTQLWAAIGARFCPQVPDLAHKIKGQTLPLIFGTYFPDEEVQSLIRQELTRFEQSMDFPFIPGVIDFLTSLQHQGVPTAIVTSSDRSKMEALYRHHPQLSSLFSAILTAEDCQRSKPAPDGYLEAARRLKTDAAQCVVFEDSRGGLQAARAAGAHVVALATTLPRETVAPLADSVITDFTGLTWPLPQ